MKAVHKVQLKSADEQTVVFNGPWSPLSVQFQNGILCLWALVDLGDIESSSDCADNLKTVFVRGTGDEVEFDLNLHDFVGTVQFGRLVYHVWVSKEVK